MVTADVQSPRLLTVAFRVKDAHASGLSSLTDGACTARSGLAAGGTVAVVAVATLDAVTRARLVDGRHPVVPGAPYRQPGVGVAGGGGANVGNEVSPG